MEPNHYFHLQFYLYSIGPTAQNTIDISDFANACIHQTNTDSQHFKHVYICNSSTEIHFTNQRNTDSQHFEHLRHPAEEIVPIFVIPYFLTLFANIHYFLLDY